MSDRQTPTLRPPDLTNLAGQETGRDHLSNSSLGVQLACMKKWDWSYRQSLELIAQPDALTLGSAFHLGIEKRDPFAAADALIRPTSNQEEEDKLQKDRATVWAAVNAYVIRYPKDKGVQRELEYLVRLRSPYTGAWSHTFDLKGIADGVIDHGAYLELIEDKFKGRIASVDVKKVKFDRQVGLSSYALWRITGKPVRVIRYRMTKKPSIKQRQNETVDAYCNRVVEDYAERPDFYFHEEQTFRDERDLLLIEQELWEYAEQLRQAKHRGVFPRNTASCDEYGGCRFLALCAGDPDAMSLYQKRQKIESKEIETT